MNGTLSGLERLWHRTAQEIIEEFHMTQLFPQAEKNIWSRLGVIHK